MRYIVCVVISGGLSVVAQAYAGTEMFSALWWMIGSPYWLLGGLLGGLLSNV